MLTEQEVVQALIPKQSPHVVIVVVIVLVIGIVAVIIIIVIVVWLLLLAVVESMAVSPLVPRTPTERESTPSLTRRKT